jgi:mannose-1-phosphate guanylyltransferase/mannose-6-phosphate isomerase
VTDTALSVVPVILAGGSGTRLWPLSRSLHPKQYLSLGVGGGTRNETLFQQSARRAAAVADSGIDVQAPCIVANEEHRFTVIEQLRDIGIEPARVLLEPFGRNTAPALQLAALEAVRAARDGVDPVLVVTPADHAIARGAAFTAAMRAAVRTAALGGIVVLGIRPQRPDTGYGYIRAGTLEGPTEESWPVAAFVEKPDTATAQRYVADGNYYWNGGIFVLRASVWLDALRRFRPDIATASEALSAARKATPRSCASTARRSRRSRPTASTTPSWSRRASRDPAFRSAWSRSTPAGATSAPGTRSGRSAPTTATATPCMATRSCATRATRSCTRPAGWSA